MLLFRIKIAIDSADKVNDAVKKVTLVLKENKVFVLNTDLRRLFVFIKAV